MAQTCSSFQQLVDYLAKLGLDNENAVPVAERFMEVCGVDFDADGNFAPLQVDYVGGELKQV